MKFAAHLKLPALLVVEIAALLCVLAFRPQLGLTTAVVSLLLLVYLTLCGFAAGRAAYIVKPTGLGYRHALGGFDWKEFNELKYVVESSEIINSQMPTASIRFVSRTGELTFPASPNMRAFAILLQTTKSQK